MRMTVVLLLGWCVAAWQSPAPPTGAADTTFLGAPERVATGVDLFRVDAPLDGEPRSLRLLRLDPTRVRLASALATGEIPARATVVEIARRTRAVAAVNAGFFSPAGDPNGLLKIDGHLLSDTGRARGAVALFEQRGAQQGLFDQVSARLRLRFKAGADWRTVPIDGVDTARGTGRLTLYTPASGATTDTTGGREWVLRGTPLRATSLPIGGNATIPGDGYVLSYGGNKAPATLSGLARASSVQVRESLAVRSTDRVREWMRATTVIGGAGLLIRNSTPLTEWTGEQLSKGFDTTPHPRTVIARDRAGLWWLITIDGRQPGRAVGMAFTAMQALLARLHVTDALNLDGGGSTTMVVGGKVVNHPSDLTGPRPVSDAIIVTLR